MENKDFFNSLKKIYPKNRLLTNKAQTGYLRIEFCNLLPGSPPCSRNS